MSSPREQTLTSLRHQLRAELDRSSYSPLRKVEFDIDGDQITLLGQVPTHFMKQLAATTIAKHVNGFQIVNKVQVVDPDRNPSTMDFG